MNKTVVQHTLQSKLNTKLLIGEPMHKHTSWRIGGEAEYFVEPTDLTELQKCIVLANELQIPLTVIGNGTNLLVLDSGIQGLVVKIGRGLDHIKIDKTTITAGAGALLPVLARRAMEKGLAGFAWSAGIPGSIGGAVIMNAGAYGASISDVIQAALVLDQDGQLRRLNKEQMGFGYRTSALQNGPWVVVEAVFNCLPGDKEAIKAQMDENNAKRKAVQPQGYPNAGSVFKNPPGDSAGRLIELAGCKGLKVGNAQVSTHHANWIVNLGGATARDVLSLIDIIKGRVKEKFDVALQLEVRVLG
ncbi:UDP-N-acetylmuramate dehydrogenase [Desulfofalx alkaliphila]|uniref:UDP-N-acetylmuramate dehydrogenase n=1 Tax=Desulfofalx alkaliphila TaxID=105483 RepID=UPI0004E1F4C2|nr:UDP-N-acetylmuramate dehydrogenase [Desulfofalx alkaliphila]